MLIYRRKPRVNRKPKMKIRIVTEKIAIASWDYLLTKECTGTSISKTLKKGQGKNST
jgi:hypothetical protein